MSWTLAIGQIMEREKKFFNYVFAALLFCLGTCQYYSLLVITDTLAVYHYLGFLHLPFLCMSGPAFYLCFKSVFWQDFKLKRRDALHSLPVMITMLLIIPLVTADENIKKEVLLHPPSFRTGNFMRTYYPSVISAILVAGLGYLIAFMKECSFLFSIKYLRENRVPPVITAVIALLSLTGVLYVISVAISNFIPDTKYFYHAIIEILSILLLFTVLLIYYMSKGDDNYFSALRIQEDRRRYEKSRTGNLDIPRTISRLKQLMEEEKIYRDENINLNSLAAILEIESYQLSQVINENFNQNYNSYINSYRIEEAKKLLVDEPGNTIVHIAYAVGFNSHGPFYEWFSKQTGESPSVYRKKHLQKWL